MVKQRATCDERHADATTPPRPAMVVESDVESDEAAQLRPAEFAQQLLATLAASEGRRRRRKRNTTPDSIGLGIKHDLLEAAMADAPEPDDFEGWLLERALAAPASGPVRALCSEIFDEYRFAAVDPNFGQWLAEGAPSADADSDNPVCEVHPLGQCPSNKDILPDPRERG